MARRNPALVPFEDGPAAFVAIIEDGGRVIGVLFDPQALVGGAQIVRSRVAVPIDAIRGAIGIMPSTCGKQPFYTVDFSVSVKGWGPSTYDAMMAWVTLQASVAGLAPSRGSLTSAAQSVWWKYGARRDVFSHSLDTVDPERQCERFRDPDLDAIYTLEIPTWYDEAVGDGRLSVEQTAARLRVSPERVIDAIIDAGSKLFDTAFAIADPSMLYATTGE